MSDGDGGTAHGIDQCVGVVGLAVGAPCNVAVGADEDELSLVGGKDVGLVERGDGVGVYGAKGGGEGALNPVAAAIANAVYRAAEILIDALEQGRPTMVFADYDVDGATSAALLILVLRDLGIEARPYIPDRLLEGYGPSGDALVRDRPRRPAAGWVVGCTAQ